MDRKRIVVCILFLVLIIPVLAACDASGMMVEVAAETTAQQISEPALKPIMARAAGADEPTRTVNLPVVLSDEEGEGPPTATATAAFFTPPPSVSPTASATFDSVITLTPSSTPSPRGQTETPTATTTNDVIGTATPTASATFTPQPGATATPTPTATKQTTATSTPTQSSQHYTNCSSRTGGNAIVAVTTDIVITGNFTFEVGDEIAVFTPDGTICAGVAVWTSTNIAVTAWGDDSQTPEQDGLRSGDTMRFRIWDASAAIEYQVTSITYQTGQGLGSGVYTVDSFHVISAITVSSP